MTDKRIFTGPICCPLGGYYVYVAHVGEFDPPLDENQYFVRGNRIELGSIDLFKRMMDSTLPMEGALTVLARLK